MIKHLSWIAAGGAIGAVARYCAVSLAALGGLTFPWGTLLVNVAGSLAIGLVIGAFGGQAGFADVAQPFLVVGVLGAFTTFSAFSHETVLLLQDARWGQALAYVVASVALSVAAAWAGLRLGAP